MGYRWRNEPDPSESSRRAEGGAASNSGGIMQMKVFYVGLDVHKTSISITVAEDGRDGAVRFIGAIPNTLSDIAKLAKRLSKDGTRLEFCYEAGGCGYSIYRQLIDLGHGCMAAAPSAQLCR